MPQVEELAFSLNADNVEYFQVALTDREDTDEVFGDMWLSPTIKIFNKTEELTQVVNPSITQLEELLREQLNKLN